MILNDHKGEIRNHYIELSEKEILDSSANICAGIRWLYRKRTTVASRLHHKATWIDAVAEYKGVLKGIIENKRPDLQGKMKKFMKLYVRFPGVTK